MKELDIIMTIAIILFLLIFVMIGISYTGRYAACKEAGMTMAGSGDCRDGNEFYTVYPTNTFSIYDHTVNKYPKMENN